MGGEGIEVQQCWTVEELNKRNTMVSFIKQTTDNEINKWWIEQTKNKSKNNKYSIEPFYIWRRRNIVA